MPSNTANHKSTTSVGLPLHIHTTYTTPTQHLVHDTHTTLGTQYSFTQRNTTVHDQQYAQFCPTVYIEIAYIHIYTLFFMPNTNCFTYQRTTLNPLFTKQHYMSNRYIQQLPLGLEGSLYKLYSQYRTE